MATSVMNSYTGPSMPEWMSAPHSTGTSIMACEFDGGVVLGADSRTTIGTYIVSRVTDKLTKITDHIYCCRSGFEADTQAIVDIVSYHLNFHKMELGEAPLVETASSIFRELCYNDRDSLVASILVAGWDKKKGGQIYSVPIGGMMQRQAVSISGSGSTHVYGYVDAHFKVNMKEAEAVKFVTNSLALAMVRDGCSGGVLRLGVITEAGVKRSVILGNQLPKFYEEMIRDKASNLYALHDIFSNLLAIKAWLAGDRSTRLCTARPTWQTMSFRQGLYKKTFTNININLVDVLEVDKKNMTVRCEPMVTMGQLSSTLDALGLSLPVVPELDQLTVGGLVMGTGIETSSHVYGLFQHICVQYELVLADGSVVTCSEDENADLFYAVPWSYGTLGFLASAVIKVVPAKKYIRLEYHPYTNLPSLATRIREEAVQQKPHQFVEALLYTEDKGVLMTGDMVDQVGEDGRYNPIGRWYTEWFYTMVERHLLTYERGNKKPVVEYIPLRHYYHRHTRSLFWELKDIISFGNHPLFRLLFGWLMPPEVSLLKLTQPEAVGRLYDKAHVIQDMLVPVESLERAVQLFHDKFRVYPMWLCPFKVPNKPGQLKVSGDWQMFVDIGVYGVPTAPGFETVAATRSVESFVTQEKGFQMLYADTYTTEEEFRRMFDHTLYDKVRESLPYCKQAFPDIYGKVNRSVRK